MSLKFRMKCVEVLCGVAFSVVGCVGFGLEYRNKCTTGLIFWLPGMIGLTLIREGMLVYDRGVGRRSEKFRELLIGWAFVGNIVLASSYKCAKTQTPIMYYSSLICIVSIDILLTLYTMSVCGDTCCPRAMFNFKRRFIPQQDADIEAPIPMQMMDRGDVPLEMTTSRTDFWKAWLESYDCVDHVYSSTLFVGKTRTLSEDVTLQDLSHLAESALTPLDRTDPTVTCIADSEALPSPHNNTHSPNVITTNDNTHPSCADTPSADRPITPPPPPGYRSVPLDSDYADDGLTCAICLLLLEETPVSEEEVSTITTPVVTPAAETDLECGAPHLTSSVAVGSRVVRYPCHGSHYFHSPCLHHWLQSVSSRLISGGGAGGVPNYHKITCPICREAPFRESVHPLVTSSTAPWPVSTSQVFTQPRPVFPPPSEVVIRAAGTITQLV